MLSYITKQNKEKIKHMRIYDYMKGILGAMGVGEDVGVPEPSWRIEEYLKAIYDKLKEGGGGSNKFIVTLTPTSPDFSGTMDKTMAQINEAYEAGQEIVFRVITSSTSHMDVACSAQWFVDGFTYPSFNAYIVDNGNNVILFAYTGITDDGTDNTYGTNVYPLTPAS